MRRGGEGNACLRVWAGAPTARGRAMQVGRGTHARGHNVPHADGQGEADRDRRVVRLRSSLGGFVVGEQKVMVFVRKTGADRKSLKQTNLF